MLIRAVPRRGHLFNAPPRERLAPEDPPNRQKGASDGTVGPDRLLAVARAGRVEAALASEQPSEGHPVKLDAADQAYPSRGPCPPHSESEPVHARAPSDLRRRSAISAATCCDFAPRIAPRATNTRSAPILGSAATSLHAALIKRRARLRCTALPTLRPATKATFPSPGAAKATTRSPIVRLPEVRTSRTLPEGRRGLRLRAVLDLCPCGERGSRDRRGSSSADGSHGSSSACGCWVGRYASSSSLSSVWFPSIPAADAAGPSPRLLPALG